MPPKKARQAWQDKVQRRWHPKQRGATPQKSEGPGDLIEQSAIPCELCGLEFEDSKSYQDHKGDPMHMELFHLANMKETAVLKYLQSHAKLQTERQNKRVDAENPAAQTKECEFCHCSVKVGSDKDLLLHQKTKHHFIAKMHMQRHCKVCVRLNRPGNQISNMKHQTSVDHIQTVIKNEECHNTVHFEKPFSQEENLLRSSDYGIEVSENFQHLKNKSEEAVDSSAEYDPNKMCGLDKISLRMKHYCLACKLPVGLNKGAVQAGLLASEMHCLSPDHYAMMVKFLENNVSEVKKDEPFDVAENETQEDAKESLEDLSAFSRSVVMRICQYPGCDCEVEVDTSFVAHMTCINHSPCSKEGRYWINPCSVCSDLLSLAKSKGPEAKEAIYALCKWVDGFRSRKKLQSEVINLYYDQEEKDVLQSLHPRLAEANSSDSSKDPTPESEPLEAPEVLSPDEDESFDITEPSSTSTSKVILMPGEAFEDYGKAVLNKSECVAQSDVISPPFNRGFRVLAGEHVFTAAYFAHVREQFTSYSRKGKLEWEEACQTFSFIPMNSDSITLLHEDFMKIFSSEQLPPTVASEQLNTPLQKLPEDLLTKDFKTRQHLFDILNMLLASETVAVTTSDEFAKGAAIATAKLALRPLLYATQAFFTARRTLRRAALKGYEFGNPHVSSLINSDPFCVKLFAKDAVEKLVQECSAQSLKVSEMLGRCKIPLKRKHSSSRQSSTSPLAKRSSTPSM